VLPEKSLVQGDVSPPEPLLRHEKTTPAPKILMSKRQLKELLWQQRPALIDGNSGRKMILLILFQTTQRIS
jgi:hypothetical protein